MQRGPSTGSPFTSEKLSTDSTDENGSSKKQNPSSSVGIRGPAFSHGHCACIRSDLPEPLRSPQFVSTRRKLDTRELSRSTVATDRDSSDCQQPWSINRHRSVVCNRRRAARVSF